jgi:hypothetical protein
MPQRMLPRNFARPPEFLIPLSNSELQELGTFTAIWSQIDWIIMMMVSSLAKTDIKPVLLMIETMTTGPRVNLLKKLCQDDPNDTKAAIKKLCENNSGLIEERNHIIHGVWGIEWNYSTNATKAACYFPKKKRKHIYAEKLIELSQRAADFSRCLGELLEQISPYVSGEKPRPFFFGDGPPPNHQPPPPWPPEQP